MHAQNIIFNGMLMKKNITLKLYFKFNYFKINMNLLEYIGI
jgi:hypothetical protein